jgi:hypothetical protein
VVALALRAAEEAAVAVEKRMIARTKRPRAKQEAEECRGAFEEVCSWLDSVAAKHYRNATPVRWKGQGDSKRIDSWLSLAKRSDAFRGSVQLPVLDAV